jgi:hypothetical protein
MFDTDLTLKSHYTSTQYDFDLDSGGILHVTAYTFEGAVERVERFLHRLEEQAAKGLVHKFFDRHLGSGYALNPRPSGRTAAC